jgi:YgiT-type zinc finger domain-containing protein
LFRGYPRLELEVDGVREVIEGVPGWICRSCGEVYRDVDDILNAKAIARLHRLGLYPNDLPAVLLMFAPFGGKDAAPIPGKTVFQKELWYLSQATESSSFPRPNFMPMQGGPWDPNLDRRLERMREKGLVTQVRRAMIGEAPTFEYSLTAEGREKISAIWAALPQSIKESTKRVKSRLNNLTAKEAVALVHREYPRMWDKSRLERWGVTLEEQEKSL